MSLTSFFVFPLHKEHNYEIRAALCVRAADRRQLDSAAHVVAVAVPAGWGRDDKPVPPEQRSERLLRRAVTRQPVERMAARLTRAQPRPQRERARWRVEVQRGRWCLRPRR